MTTAQNLEGKTTFNELIISVVVHTWDADDIENCLKSLNTAIEDATTKRHIGKSTLYLMYNGNEHLDLHITELFVHSHYKQPVNLKLNCENKGYGGTNNTTIRQEVTIPTREKCLIVMNSDLILDKLSISHACELLSSSEKPGLVAPMLLSLDGTEQVYGNKRYPNICTLLARLFPMLLRLKFFENLNTLYEYRSDQDKNLKMVQICSGSFLLATHEFWFKLGGFNEDFFMYFEDFDLSIRANKLGCEHLYNANVKIKHKGGETGKKPLYHKWLFIQSAFKFFNRHGWKWY